MDGQELMISDEDSGQLVPAAGLMSAAEDAYLAGHPENTRRAYQDRLDQFRVWRKKRPPAPFVAHLREYIAHLRDERGLAPRSVQAHINTVKGLLRMAASLDTTGRLALALPQLDLVKPPPVRGAIVGERLTEAERARLLSAPGLNTHKGRRDTAILALLAVCGLRRSEVVGLTWSHLAEVDGHKAIKNLSGKHGRVRTVYMPPSLWRRIHDWGKQAELSRSSGAPLFVRVRRWDKVQPDEPITPDAVAWLVGEYALRAGLVDRDGNARVKPHDLRRTAARLMRDAGAPIESVKELLGHKSAQTTEVYIGGKLDLDEQASYLAGVKVP